MVIQPKVIIEIKAIADLKKVVETQRTLQQLEKLGLRPAGKGFRDLNDRYLSVNDAAKKAQPIFQRFRMELLSVMFFGMAVQRTFSAMLNPARELTGETKLWGDTMALFFLPYAMDTLGWALAFQDVMLKLNEATDGWAGRIAGWGAAVGEFAGTLLMMVGQLGLGIQGMVTFKATTIGTKTADFLMSGWTAVTKAMATVGKWILKPFKVVVNVALDAASWIATKLGLSTLSKWQGRIIKVAVVVGLVWVGWQIGKAVGEWLKPYLEDFFDIPEDSTIFEEWFIKPKARQLGIPEEQIPKWPGIDLSAYGLQHGGIVTKPTLAMIGEAGPEAIIPLTGAGAGAGMVFNNSFIINATIGSDMDVRELGRKIADYQAQEIRGLVA